MGVCIMKKTLRVLCSLILFIFLLPGIPTVVRAATVIETGSCGANVSYTLDTDGTLTLSGTGAINDYEYETSGGSSPFADKTAIKKVVINKGITSVGDCLFTNCTGLETVEMGDSVMKIGESAFFGCPLTSADIPAGVTSIEKDAFLKGTGNFTVAAGNACYRAVNGVLFDYSGKTLVCYPGGKTDSSYTVPAGTEVIGSMAFAMAENLVTVSIPDSVKSIGEMAFYGCTRLSGMALPDKLTKMEERLFYSCTSLTYVRIPSGVTEIAGSAFGLTMVSNIEYDGCMDCWNKITNYSSSDMSSKLTCLYSTWKSNGDATCLKDGTKTKACRICGALSAKEEDTVADVGSITADHNLSYSVSTGVITGNCKTSGCTFQETVKLRVANKEYAYTGKAVCPAEVIYSDGWEGKKEGVLTYTDNISPGRATAKLTIGGVSVQETFTIVNNYRAEAGKDYQITSSNSSLNLVVTAKDGYELSLTDTADGSWKKTLKAKKKTSGGSLCFYVRNCSTGEISLAVKESLKLSVKALRTGNTNKLVASQKVKNKNGKLKITWQKVDEAKGYELYVTECGNKNFPKKPTKTINKRSTTSYTVSKLSGKKIDSDTAYKVKVKAFYKRNGKKVYIGSTQTLYVVSNKNETYTNAKKVSVTKKIITLKSGKTSVISARVVKENKNKKLLDNVAKFRYYSTDKAVATVNSRGKIKAVSLGTAKIYVIAGNGVKATVTVKVV